MDTSDERTTEESGSESNGFGSIFSHQTSDRPAAAAEPAASDGGFDTLFQAPDLTDLPAQPKRSSKAGESAQDDPESDSDEDAGSGKGSRRSTQSRKKGKGKSADSDAGEESGDSGSPRSRRGKSASNGEGADDASTGTSADDASDHDNSDDSDDSDDGDSRGRRRRRRGGKGRRGRSGGDSDDASSSESAAESTSGSSDGGKGSRSKSDSGSADSTNDAGDDDGDGSSKRRRRRRREDGSSRGGRNEVSGVKGSTRLEAKRQRRREGREAGRRRTVISEAEFLARRESVERTMIVRGLPDRTQIGVLEDGVLAEHYVSRSSQTTTVGNVYLGRVQNVLPSMEAAFVDIGKGRNAVLYAGEVNWAAAGLDNQPKRIENALKSGEPVLVQVTKDPIGHKGARLTSQVSLPGRYLVYVPGGSMTGISRKLPDTERTRLKKILREVVPEDAGVIVRTAAEGASEAELRADVERLTKIWERIQSKSMTANAPAVLHSEAEMTTRVIRDIFNEDISSLVVSGDDAWDEVSSYVSSVAPDLTDRVTRWEPEEGGAEDIFAHYRVHEALAKALDRKVWLPSGGSLVIDRTEAMIVVDVNTGKFVGSGGDLEETVTKNNLEAAEEIVRQLRLRDIGGIIVIDFIDMVLESNRELVVRRLLECLGRDRTKHQVAEVTSLGLVQMTRKRVGSGLVEVFSETCSHCTGRGIITHPEPIEKANEPAQGQGRRGKSQGQKHGGNSGSKNGNGKNGNAKNGNGGAASLPAPNPNGPTPAQIAAAAHAAAVQAVSNSVDKGDGEAQPDPQSGETVTDSAADQAIDASNAAEAPVSTVTPEPVAPARKTRRRVKSAVTAPATSASPVMTATETGRQTGTESGTETGGEQDANGAGAAPLTVSAAEVPATPVEAGDAASAAPTAAPAPKRRRRGRVVSPAGPPVAPEDDNGDAAAAGSDPAGES